MMVKIMSDSKRIKEKVHFHVSGLAGAVQISFCYFSFNHNFACKIYSILFQKYTFSKKDRVRK